MTAVGGIKKITVMKGQEEAFLSLFFEMREHIQNENAGTVYYDLYRSRNSERSFIVTERYTDEAAWQAHQDAEYGKIYFPKIRAILESIEVEYFDAVAS